MRVFCIDANDGCVISDGAVEIFLLKVAVAAIMLGQIVISIELDRCGGVGDGAIVFVFPLPKDRAAVVSVARLVRLSRTALQRACACRIGRRPSCRLYPTETREGGAAVERWICRPSSLHRMFIIVLPLWPNFGGPFFLWLLNNVIMLQVPHGQPLSTAMAYRRMSGRRHGSFGGKFPF